MKKLNILLLGGLLAFGLASCEMKDELWGEKESTDKGLLDLGVAFKKSQQTKAGGETDDFPVIIEKTDGTQVDSLTYSEINGPVELTVGTYTIRAHSAEKLEKRMKVPYYAGETAVTIEKGSTAKADISCTMKNTKIQFSLSELVGGGYDSWTVSANAGGEFAYSVSGNTETNVDNVAPIYWYLNGTVSEIKVDVTATKDGKTYKGHTVFHKSDADETYEDDDAQFFGGGESLTIQIKPTIDEDGGDEGGDSGDGGDEGGDGGDDKPTTPEQGTIGDFEISVDITFEDSEDTVNIPVDGTGSGDSSTTTPGGDGTEEKPDDGGNTGGGTTDDKPTDTAITISDNGTGYLTNGVTVTDGKYPDDVAVVMNVPNGIKNVYVKVDTDNPDFASAAGSMGLTTGEGLDLTGEQAKTLSSLFDLPNVGDQEYTFTMNSTLFGLLTTTPGFPGKHDFHLTVIDQNKKQKSATLTINISE